MSTTSGRRYARSAGMLYLLTHVTSVLAVVAYDGGHTVLGVVLELLLALGCLGTGVLLALLLHRHGPARAATFVLLRGVEAAVILAGTMPMLALAWSDGLAGPDHDLLTQLHAASFLVGQGLVIGVNTIVLGSLLLASRAVPRPLAQLGIVGGGLVLVSDLAQAAGLIPMSGALAGALAVPIFAFEIWLAIRLLVLGLRGAVPEPAGSVDAGAVGSN